MRCADKMSAGDPIPIFCVCRRHKRQADGRFEGEADIRGHVAARPQLTRSRQWIAAAFANKRPIFFLPFVAVDAEAYVAR